MSGTKVHEDTWKLIQPELLSTAELVEILKERGIKLQDDDIVCKNRLIEIFKRVVTPLPQRNRFGHAPVHSSRGQERSMKTSTAIKRSSSSLDQCGAKQNLQIKKPPTTTTTKLKLKRSIEVMQMNTDKAEKNGSGESVPKKREKITWP